MWYDLWLDLWVFGLWTSLDIILFLEIYLFYFETILCVHTNLCPFYCMFYYSFKKSVRFFKNLFYLICLIQHQYFSNYLLEDLFLSISFSLCLFCASVIALVFSLLLFNNLICRTFEKFNLFILWLLIYLDFYLFVLLSLYLVYLLCHTGYICNSLIWVSYFSLWF